MSGKKVSATFSAKHRLGRYAEEATGHLFPDRSCNVSGKALAAGKMVDVSGKALAAGKMIEKQRKKPAASALPLTNLALSS